MRLLLMACAGLIATAPAVAAPALAGPITTPKYSAPAHCPRTTNHYAAEPGKPLKPRKLTELPPAIGYMAVYRTVNGCEVPMTIIEYRTGRKP